MRDFEARALARQKGLTVPARACRFFGDATGETIECKTCNGKVSLKVFACEVHGKCTPAKIVKDVACCNGCKDRA